MHIKSYLKQNLVIIGVGLLLGSWGLSSCNKWLDVKPKTEVREDDLFSSVSGYKDALTGVYTEMTKGSLYGRDLTFGFMSVLAQNYDISKDHSYYEISKYNYSAGNVESRINSIWSNMYNVIANVNDILKQVDQNKQLFDDIDYKLIKGEALGLRAFLHFDLLRMFAPSYANDPQAPAIPYVTKLSKNVTPLSTVSEVMDSVIRDLKDAKALLSVYKEIDDYTASGFLPDQDLLLSFRQNHFNYWAACAELARVYLYKDDKINAKKQADEVIDSEQFGFVNEANVSAPTGYRDRTFIPGQVFALSDYHLASIVPTYFKGAQNYDNRLTLTESEVDALFETGNGGTTDYRYAYLWGNDASTLYPTKFWQDDDILEDYKNLMPIIRVTEMYYIAAESTSDPSEAVDYLNTVRSHRGIQDLPDNLDQDQLQEEIFKAYEKEFYAEGQLFYYYKRLDLDHIDKAAVTADNKVYVFPLPDDEILYGDR